MEDKFIVYICNRNNPNLRKDLYVKTFDTLDEATEKFNEVDVARFYADITFEKTGKMIINNNYTMLTFDDVHLPLDNNYREGDILVLNPKGLNVNYQSSVFQLFVCDGSGFGCDGSNMGNAIFGHYLVDKEKARVERYNVYGIINDDSMEKMKVILGGD